MARLVSSTVEPETLQPDIVQDGRVRLLVHWDAVQKEITDDMGTRAEWEYQEQVLWVPLPGSDGYVSALLEDELGGLAIMPSATGGSSSTYLCDNWFAPVGSDRILLAGGDWYSARRAGPGCRYARFTGTDSYRDRGARVEFRPPEEEE